jgi:hypothetical protein
MANLKSNLQSAPLRFIVDIAPRSLGIALTALGHIVVLGKTDKTAADQFFVYLHFPKSHRTPIFCELRDLVRF